MKRTIVILTVLVMCISLVAGCSNTETSTPTASSVTQTEASTTASQPETEAPATTSGDDYSDYYTGENVSLMVPFAAGGGADTCTRILAPYLEAELGCTITVENPTGGGGWVGWEDFLKRPADGMNLANINNTATLNGYLNPEYERDVELDDFIWIANVVMDPIIISIMPGDTRFSNFEELVEYARQQPTTFGTSGVGTVSSVALYRLNEALGTQFVEVPSAGWSEGSAALMGGHIDCAGCTVGDANSQMADETIVATVILAEERSEFAPDIPTLDELAITDEKVYVNSSRGYGVVAGTPDEIVSILSDAFEAAANNPEFIADMAKITMQVTYLGGDDYFDYISSEEATLLSLSDVFGWS